MKQEKQTKNKNSPVQKFVSGVLHVAVWETIIEKDKKTMKFYNVTYERSYKDKDDDWQKTTNIQAQDIPKVVMLLNKAYEWIYLKEVDDLV
jgi:hypothetical protein